MNTAEALRTRMASDIIKGIREACGQDFIIGVRMPVHKWESDNISDEESVQIAKIYEAAGVDYLNINVGYAPNTTSTMETGRYEEGDRLDLPAKIKGKVNVPVFGAGMLKEPEMCEKAIAEGVMDFAVVGRALIADPFWPEKAREGKACEIRNCLSCLDGCYENLLKNVSIRCAVNPEVGFELEKNMLQPPEKLKKVLVIGGGPAEMQAAITAAERGHNVTLIEKADRLGGQLNIASVPPYKQYISKYRNWMAAELDRKGVDVKTGFGADKEFLKDFGADEVIVATGSAPWIPPVKGIEKGVQAWDLLSGKTESPENKNAVIIGGGIVGCETASYLDKKGNSVTIIEMLPNLANGLDSSNKADMFEEFKERGIRALTSAAIMSVGDDKVIVKKDGSESEVEFDMLVVAAGQRSAGQDVVAILEELGIKYTVTGDAVKPSKIINATLSGYNAGINL